MRFPTRTTHRRSPRPIRRATALIAAGTVAAGALTAVPATAEEGTARLAITAPVFGQHVDSDVVEVRGTVDAQTGEKTHVMFVVDVSGSTGWTNSLDCNGDGHSAEDDVYTVTDAASDDLNSDGNVGDVLDCEISAVTSLNSTLAAMPGADRGIDVGVTAFAASARVADMDPGPVTDAFVAPGSTGKGTSLPEDAPRNDEVTPWVSQVANSLTAEHLGLFTSSWLTSGTNFNAALNAALNAFDTVAGPKQMFFISDGDTYQLSSTTLTRLASSGVHARTFAVGQQFASDPCAVGAGLRQIAESGGGTCATVPDPTVLTATLADPPATVKRVEVVAQGGVGPATAPVLATIDTLGNWSARVPGIGLAGQQITATAYFTDGTTETQTVTIYGTAPEHSYVALGDSYAAGEGIEPYYDQFAGDEQRAVSDAFLCHRSTIGWPTLVRRPGDDLPWETRADFSPADHKFDSRACSGARIPHANAKEQSKTYRDFERRDMPFQLDALNPSVDLVTVSLGGNDIWFSEVADHCAKTRSCWADTFITTSDGEEVTLADWATIRLALIGSDLRGLYKGIRDRTSAAATIIATTYPRLMGDGNGGDALCNLITDGESRWLRQQVDLFASIIAHNATYSDVLVADVRAAFDGHLACDGDDPWLYNLEPIRETDLREEKLGWRPPFMDSSDASLHPVAKGAEAYAAVVNSVLASGQSKVTSLSTKPVAQAAPGEWWPSTDPRVVTHPEVVLASFPDTVVEAVEEFEWGVLTLASGAAIEGLPACEQLVPGEVVPFALNAFAPASTVTVTVETSRRGTPTGRKTLTVTTDAAGQAESSFAVPVSATAGDTVTVEARGTGPVGGIALASKVAQVTDRATCVEGVEDSGYTTIQPNPTNPTNPANPPRPDQQEPSGGPQLRATTAPTVLGKAHFSAALGSTLGTWTSAPARTTVQWFRDGAPIAGATSATYKVTKADIDRALSVAVTATDAAGRVATATSGTVRGTKAPTRVHAKVRTSARPVELRVSVRRPSGVPAAARLVVRVAGHGKVAAKTNRSGRAVVRLPRVSAGKYKVQVTWNGTPTLTGAAKTLMWNVRR